VLLQVATILKKCAISLNPSLPVAASKDRQNVPHTITGIPFTETGVYAKGHVFEISIPERVYLFVYMHHQCTSANLLPDHIRFPGINLEI
jgi:hypothetical protein